MSTNKSETVNIVLSEWISQAEASRLRGCSRQAISKLIRKQKFNTLEAGGHVLVNREEVLGYKDGSAGRPKSKYEHSGDKKVN